MSTCIKTQTMPITSAEQEQMEKELKAMLGFIPNSIQEMLVKSPYATATYINAMKTKKQYSQLTFLERQVMEMAVSVFNGDVYCIGMHEHFLRKTNTFSEEDINELKIGGLPSQKDLHPVLKATRLILTRKGNVTDAERSYLEDIGITRPKMYEIAASICQKGVQNYINNIAKPTLDDEFK